MMSFTSREVLIPLAGQGATGVLCRAAADGHLPPHHPAHLDRSISDLLESGLYRAGQQARAAVRRLRLNGGWFSRPAPVALSIVNPGDVAGLAPSNSASAEFGLALAMLMFITQSPNQIVIASGALEPNSTDPNAPIRSVHHLLTKFSVVEQYFQQSGITAPPALFFTPELDTDGTPVRDRYAEPIAHLRTMGISVVPVQTLREAAARLRATRLQIRPYERWLQRGAIAAVLLGALSMAAIWAVRRPIPMEFRAVSLDDGRIVQTPVRLLGRPDGSDELLPPCRPGGGLPAYRAGDRIRVKIGSGDPNDWVGYFGANYHAMVAISTTAAVVKIAPLETTPPGGTIDFQDSVEPSLDAFFIVTRRLRPFDIDRLREQLHKRIDELNVSERLNAARAFLREAASGVLEYDFRVESGGKDCPDE
jgi:hypothetical protein